MSLVQLNYAASQRTSHSYRSPDSACACRHFPRRSSRFAASSADKKLMPVIFPPGRATLAKTNSDRVIEDDEHDGDRRFCGLSRERRSGTSGGDYGHPRANQVSRQHRQSSTFGSHRALVDRHVQSRPRALEHPPDAHMRDLPPDVPLGTPVRRPTLDLCAVEAGAPLRPQTAPSTLYSPRRVFLNSRRGVTRLMPLRINRTLHRGTDHEKEQAH
jgi:hypothetical protein